MSPMIERFGLDSLSTEDRLALALALWDSVHDVQDREPIAPEVRGELILKFKMRKIALELYYTIY